MRNLFTVLFLVGFLSIFAGGAVARADSYDVRVSLQAKNPSRNWSEFISSVTRDVRFVLEDQYACHFESELSWKIQGQSGNRQVPTKIFSHLVRRVTERTF